MAIQTSHLAPGFLGTVFGQKHVLPFQQSIIDYLEVNRSHEYVISYQDQFDALKSIFAMTIPSKLPLVLILRETERYDFLFKTLASNGIGVVFLTSNKSFKEAEKLTASLQNGTSSVLVITPDLYSRYCSNPSFYLHFPLKTVFTFLDAEKGIPSSTKFTAAYLQAHFLLRRLPTLEIAAKGEFSIIHVAKNAGNAAMDAHYPSSNTLLLSRTYANARIAALEVKGFKSVLSELMRCITEKQNNRTAVINMNNYKHDEVVDAIKNSANFSDITSVPYSQVGAEIESFWKAAKSSSQSIKPLLITKRIHQLDGYLFSRYILVGLPISFSEIGELLSMAGVARYPIEINIIKRVDEERLAYGRLNSIIPAEKGMTDLLNLISDRSVDREQGLSGKEITKLFKDAGLNYNSGRAAVGLFEAYGVLTRHSQKTSAGFYTTYKANPTALNFANESLSVYRNLMRTELNSVLACFGTSCRTNQVKQFYKSSETNLVPCGLCDACNPAKVSGPKFVAFQDNAAPQPQKVVKRLDIGLLRSDLIQIAISVANKFDVPRQSVLSDESVDEIIRLMPTTVNELKRCRQLSGSDNRRIEMFGDAILKSIRIHNNV